MSAYLRGFAKIEFDYWVSAQNDCVKNMVLASKCESTARAAVICGSHVKNNLLCLVQKTLKSTDHSSSVPTEDTR